MKKSSRKKMELEDLAGMVKGGFDEVHGEMKQGFDEVYGKMKRGFGEVHQRMDKLQDHLESRIDSLELKISATASSWYRDFDELQERMAEIEKRINSIEDILTK